jgi:hypothetical protein
MSGSVFTSRIKFQSQAVDYVPERQRSPEQEIDVRTDDSVILEMEVNGDLKLISLMLKFWRCR